jgi:hypothetical protein
VEPPSHLITGYISDGRGTVRILARKENKIQNVDSGVFGYMYRQPGSRDWHKLGEYDEVNYTGFKPIAVDPDLNVAYGLKKKDGRELVTWDDLDHQLEDSAVRTQMLRQSDAFPRRAFGM